MFSEAGAMQWVWFVFGFIIWCIYTYYNIQQIKENSDGEENFFHGESDYRKLSVILIFTWFPFPCWFILSPEGLGVITDVTVIQLGWAVLNVTAKFGFILHLQYIKSKYCKTLDATRELYGMSPGTDIAKAEVEDPVEGLDEGSDGEQKIRTLISETMISLGMASHTARFMKLMLDNGVVTTDILERVNQERASDINLPWSLVDAVQKRWRAEKLNLGQDQGGLVEKEDPFKKLLAEGKARRHLPGSPGDVHLPGSLTPPVAQYMPAMSPADDARISALEANMNHVMHQLGDISGILESVASKINQFESSQDSICQRLDFAQQAQLQTLNSSQVLLHKIDSAQESLVRKVADQKDILGKISAAQDVLGDAVAGSKDATKNALLDSVASSGKALLQKLDSSQQALLQKQVESHEVLLKVHNSQHGIVQKLDSASEAASRRSVQSETKINSSLQELSANMAGTCTEAVTRMSQLMQKDIGMVKDHCAATSEVVQNGLAAQEERMADVRRQNMMIMDMITGTHERMMESANDIWNFSRRELTHGVSSAQLEVELRGVISDEMRRLQDYLQETLMSSKRLPEDGDQGAGVLASVLGSAADRLETAAKRLESGHQAAEDSSQFEGLIRQEISGLALALSQHQREMLEQLQQQVGQVETGVGEKVRQELIGTVDHLQSKVDLFGNSLDQNMGRFEQGVDKILTAASPTERDSRRKAVERG
eukprot:TRINITY_DN3700_c0_g1_i1.p1 TRINITY_DN3700_c0_g1~~TRINITY_DN3700_c0_g1_i1.p1  ORF type:complete len:787 (-),score=182.27 TRINITY_DN3700_c0_g1_i1:329-2470(-)